MKKFKLEYEQNGQWKTIDQQTTIGYKRLLRFPAVTATKVRFTIEDAKASPLISNIGFYNAPVLLLTPKVVRNKKGEVSLIPADETTEIYYTLDGTEPTQQSVRYTAPFAVNAATQLKSSRF